MTGSNKRQEKETKILFINVLGVVGMLVVFSEISFFGLVFVTRVTTSNKNRMNVKVRTKKLASGKESIYLDIYANGKREYEFLKLYLEPGKSSVIKAKNKGTLRLAETICARRLLQIQKGNFGIESEYNGKTLLKDYFRDMLEHRKETGVNFSTWRSTMKHLREYPKNDVKLLDVDEKWLEKFRAFLLRRVGQNSAHTYFNKIKRVIHTAHRDGLIPSDPAHRVSSPAQVDTQREYLTEQELLALAKTECRKPVLKRAFLFSALTGLRWSDIEKLKWSEIRYSEENGFQIDFSQRKTKHFEYHPVTEQALELLGEPTAKKHRVFKGLKYSAHNNIAIAQWVMKAGITKHITFHCARHTYATLLLTKGAELYTVSKLLGHKEVRTTQVYGKIVNSLKVEAVNSLPKLDLDGIE